MCWVRHIEISNPNQGFIQKGMGFHLSIASPTHPPEFQKFNTIIIRQLLNHCGFQCDEYLHLFNVFFINIISYMPQKPPEATSESLDLNIFRENTATSSMIIDLCIIFCYSLPSPQIHFLYETLVVQSYYA